MSRFLFVVPTMAGHINPTIAVGRELIARGHEAAWVGPEEIVSDVLPDDLTHLVAPLSDQLRDMAANGIPDLWGPAALRHLIAEFLVPLAECMIPGVRAAVAEFRPDALIVDQQAVAGVAVACAEGLPWATSATTSASLTATLADAPKVKAWAEGMQRDVLREAGVDEHTAATIDLWHSPHLVLVFSTADFVGQPDVPDNYAFVGPSLGQRGPDVPFDWGWLDHDGPTVLVTLGTLNTRNGGRFLAAAAEALAGVEARGVIVAPPDLVPSPPANVLVAERVPQLALMPRLDAVVTHGGHNTVCEALAHGLPLVVAPIRDDQPVIAEQVVRAGAGVRVIFRRVRADGLRTAIETALGDPDLRAGAERVRRSFAAAGGPAAAADRIEALPALAATTRHPTEV